MVPKDIRRKTFKESLIKFAIRFTSGMMATVVVQPNDLIKTRMQLLKNPYHKNHKYFNMFGTIVNSDGVLGLYRGLSAALFRQATYSSGRLYIMHILLEDYKYASLGKPPNVATRLRIGIISGGVGGFMAAPAEVVLIRMTADGRLPPTKRKNYKNVFNAFQRISKEEGAFTLWRGTGTTILRSMIVSAVQLGAYAQVRGVIYPAIKDRMPLHFIASMVSGLIAAAVALPIDIVKTRVQNAKKRTSQLKTFQNVMKYEGVASLWTGFWPTSLKIGLHTVLTFALIGKF